MFLKHFQPLTVRNAGKEIKFFGHGSPFGYLFSTLLSQQAKHISPENAFGLCPRKITK